MSEDIVQAVLVAIAEMPVERLREIENLELYARTVMRNRIIDLSRHKRRFVELRHEYDLQDERSAVESAIGNMNDDVEFLAMLPDALVAPVALQAGGTYNPRSGRVFGTHRSNGQAQNLSGGAGASRLPCNQAGGFVECAELVEDPEGKTRQAYKGCLSAQRETGTPHRMTARSTHAESTFVVERAL